MHAATCVRATLAALLALGTPAGAPEVVKKSDSQIKAQVEAALEADEALSGSSIHVRSVNDGVVFVAGRAKTATDDLRAMGDAARVPGVRRIVSEIRSRIRWPTRSPRARERPRSRLGTTGAPPRVTCGSRWPPSSASWRTAGPRAATSASTPATER